MELLLETYFPKYNLIFKFSYILKSGKRLSTFFPIFFLHESIDTAIQQRSGVAVKGVSKITLHFEEM